MCQGRLRQRSQRLRVFSWYALCRPRVFSSGDIDCLSLSWPSAMPTRRFPPPWTAEVTPNCFTVRDASGQQVPMSIMSASRGGNQRPSCSARMRREGSRRTRAHPASVWRVRLDPAVFSLQPASHWRTSTTAPWHQAVDGALYRR